jgi:hypothetical protein
MNGAKEVIVFSVDLMTTQAVLVRFFRWSDRELKEFGLVAAGFHVGFTGAVAIFACSGASDVTLSL